MMAATLKTAKVQLMKAKNRLTHAETALRSLIDGAPTYTALLRKHADLLEAQEAHKAAFDKLIKATEAKGAVDIATTDFNTLDNRIVTLKDEILVKIELLQAGLDQHGVPLPPKAVQLDRLLGIWNGQWKIATSELNVIKAALQANKTNTCQILAVWEHELELERAVLQDSDRLYTQIFQLEP